VLPLNALVLIVQIAILRLQTLKLFLALMLLLDVLDKLLVDVGDRIVEQSVLLLESLEISGLLLGQLHLLMEVME
jgi:hypothetical protein